MCCEMAICVMWFDQHLEVLHIHQLILLPLVLPLFEEVHCPVNTPVHKYVSCDRLNHTNNCKAFLSVQNIYTVHCHFIWSELQNKHGKLVGRLLIHPESEKMKSYQGQSLLYSGWTGLLDLVANTTLIGSSDGKESACNAGDPGWIPGSGRSLEKEMAIHSSILSWRIPWIEEPDGLQSTGSQSQKWVTLLLLPH